MSNRYTRHEALYAALEDVAAVKGGMIFLEVGTGDGEWAKKLCRFWKEQTGGIFRYIGFDDFSLETKMTVGEAIRLVGADVDIIAGNTRDTVPTFADVMRGQLVPDVVFVRGRRGGSEVAEDWNALRNLVGERTIILFDNYYETADGLGCNIAVKQLQREPAWNVQLLDPVDVVDGLGVRMVRVERNKQANRKAA